MTRLKALNESSSDECEDENEEKETVEAQEERAFSQYKKALELRHLGKFSDAEHLLISLLDGDFLCNVSSAGKIEASEGLARPATALKYACLKNLGDVLVLEDRAEDGLQCLIQAVELDSSDVTLWQRLGTVALQVDNFPLASHAFQAGLGCNPRHWPCLDALLPVLYALEDYQGCLLLAARTLQLDPDYPQALALCSQISNEQPSLQADFAVLYPGENMFDKLPPQEQIPEASDLISHAQSLRERFRSKTEYKWCKEIPVPEYGHQQVTVSDKSWVELGKSLLKFHSLRLSDKSTSLLHPVKLSLLVSEKNKTDGATAKDSSLEISTLKSSVAQVNVDADSELMDVDSEHDAKGEDQTEEDATEASGHEQEEDNAQKDLNGAVEPVLSAKKRKQRRSSNSLSLIDQWSKRRSGRRAGRKVEEKDESNLVSRFRSFLPESLLPKDLEVQIAKASKKRSARDPMELLCWTEDSMDTMELYRFLQERDAQDENQRQRRPLGKDDVARIVADENYFGKERELQDVTQFLEEHGLGTKNIMEVIYDYVNELAQKDTFTWPCYLVTVFIEAFECVRKHFPFPSPLDSSIPNEKHHMDVLSSLLYCELCVDLKQLRNQKDAPEFGENLLLSSALGQLTLLCCQSHLFSSIEEQCRLIVRFRWLKVHLFLMQENPMSAINSLQDVLIALEAVENANVGNHLSRENEEFAKPDALSQSEPGFVDITPDKNVSDFADTKLPSSPVNKTVSNANVVQEGEETPLSTMEVVCEEPSGHSPRIPCVDQESSAPEDVVGPKCNVDITDSKLESKKAEDILESALGSTTQDSIADENSSHTHPSLGQASCETTIAQVLTTEPSSCLAQVSDTGLEEKKAQSELNDKEEKKAQSELNDKEEKKSLPDRGNQTEREIASEKRKSNLNIVLPNARINRTINKVAVQKLLLSLTRQQQLSEVDDLYKNQQYEALSGTLTECFKFCAQQADAECAADDSEVENFPDRPTQMAMLLDSLWQLKRYSDCFYWTEACLYEAFNRYLSCSESDGGLREGEDQQMWATTIERLLAGLESCLKVAGLSQMERLPKNCLTRLVQTLTSILCQQLEQSDSSLEMAIDCVTPWVILHRVVYFEEQHHARRSDVIPSFMRVLFTAHEYMARNSRCCLNEGILLNLILDVVVPVCRSPELSGVRIKLSHHVEQAIFCLYGHPKKARDSNRKKLQDHKVPLQVELTWERSLLLLQFYEPDELPIYDSPTNKISADEEQLFLRISQLVPESYNINKCLSKIRAYVTGKVDKFVEVQCPLPPQAQNLYYLIADYYLKTFKWEAAIKYYMLDVSVNPNRFDSWAGMALARAALLTTEINSCDTLNNDMLLLKKTKAQRSFQKAVDLDPEQSTIWIEYGNFTYALHSFCSRLLKTETDSLSLEMFTKVEEEKDKMLTFTETCFRAAEKLGQDEGWLHQYMLGKVAEKRGDKPAVFLCHYRAAAKLLSESKAEYPSTLDYDAGQTYAFEAHEVHYRIHASILKILESLEGKPLDDDNQRLFKATLAEAARSPFMSQCAGLAQTILTNLGENYPNSAKRKSPDSLIGMTKKIKRVENVVGDLNEDSTTKSTNINFFVQSKTVSDSSESSLCKTERKAEVHVAEISTVQLLSNECAADPATFISSSSTSAVHANANKDKDAPDNFSINDIDNKNPIQEKSPSASPNVNVSISVTHVGSGCETATQSLNSLNHVSEKDLSIKTSENILTSEHGQKLAGDDQVEAVHSCVEEVDKSNTAQFNEKQDAVDGNKCDSSNSSSSSSGSTSSSASSSDSESCWDDGTEKNALKSPVNSISDQMEKDMHIRKDSTNVQSIKIVEENKKDKNKKDMINITNVQPANIRPKVLDHFVLIKPCLLAMEECLVRYPRHYKSFYRLSHYYFRSKEHRNLKKCRQLLLGEYEIAHSNKPLSGLFKFVSINTMFNSMWRMPIEEVDRAGSFASHMSRCVVLLMELLRDQRDHNLLLKLSLFLKKDPEKKDRKYLRDNERVDLSKQALGMCCTALRVCLNQISTENDVVDLYLTVKEGIKEVTHKEGFFKTILSDAFKKVRNMKVDASVYDLAAEFCQNELNLRKALAQKVAQAAQAAQVAQAAQATQVVQAAQMNNMISPLYNPGTPRFPNSANTALRGNMASPIFLPKAPVSRGRGRPPKAQRLNNPMSWMNLSGMVDPRLMQIFQQEQQRQRLPQQPASVSTSQSSFVTDIAKDRPAISITAFPAGKNSSSPHVAVANSTSSVSTSTGMGRVSSDPTPKASSIDSLSRAAIIQGNSMAWQAPPRQQSLLRPMSPRFSGFSPRNNFSGNSPILGGLNPLRRGNMRLKGPRSQIPPNLGPPMFHQQGARPSIARPKVDPSVAYLSRLPGLQVEQRLQAGSSGANPSKTFVRPQREKEAAIARQQLLQLQNVSKTASQNVLARKPSVSISKVPTDLKPSQGSSGTDSQRNVKDPNVDIITLD